MSAKPSASDMPKVVPIEELEKRFAYFHAKLDLQTRYLIGEWLKALPALEAEVTKWLNKSVTNASKGAIRRAVLTRSNRIAFVIDIEKMAKSMLLNIHEEHRAKVDAEKLLFAFVFLAEEAGYPVADGKISIDHVITEKVNLSQPAKASSAPAIEGESKDADVIVELAEEAMEPTLALLAGKIYSNDKGTTRKILSIERDRIKYVVVASENKRTRPGSEGETSVRSFLLWASREVV